MLETPLKQLTKLMYEISFSQLDKSPVEPNQNILSAEDNSLQNVKHAVCSGQVFSWPRKTDLKVSRSSAFFNYVKSKTPTSNSHFSLVDQESYELFNGEENLYVGGNIEGRNCKDVHESNSLECSIPSSENACNKNMLKVPGESSMVCQTSPSNHLLSRTERRVEVPRMPFVFHLPIYLHGQSSSMQGFQGASYDLHLQNPISLLHQYNVLPQAHHTHLMRHLAYHPFGISLPLGNTLSTHQWSSSARSHKPQSKNFPTEMREAALMKFKQKRKDLCYHKKIRYINRKLLAEKRPRVQGQFVRQVTGVDIQLNDSPAMKDYDSEEEEDETLSRTIS